MKALCYKPFLLIMLVLGTTFTSAQYNWTKHPGNPLNIHGSQGSWDQSVLAPYVIFNSDSNRYEMWYTAFWAGVSPSEGIGFAYSDDGIIWIKHPVAVMRPSTTGWDSFFVGAPCIIKESGLYKMWYTGWESTSWVPKSIGYATSPDGINWTKHPTPVLTPGSGWESGAVAYPSVIKVTGGYVMFYTGESPALGLTGRASSSDGITWQRYINNPVLPAGGTGEWDQNNYLARVLALNDSLYMWYTAESNPGVSGTAIGLAASADTGKTWMKYSDNPLFTRGTTGTWDYGWIETGSVLFTQNELKLYYDGGGTATGNQGRVGLATAPFVPVSAGQEITLITEFALEQNHPNPFNPNTNVKYSVPQLSIVTIKVFDILGNEIETLVNEEKPAGQYEVNWNAADLPSGVYFYQLKAIPIGRQAGDFVSTKKMILLR